MLAVLSRGALALCALAAMLVVRVDAARADGPVRKVLRGRQAKDEALRAMPLDKLAADDRQRVETVLSDTTMYRTLPTQVIRCDPKLYQFLIVRPHVTVNLWNVLGVSNITLEKTAPDTFRGNDHQGTTGTIRYLYKEPLTQLILADGQYEGPLFKQKIAGQCVVLVRAQIEEAAGHSPVVTCRLDTFLRVENGGVDFIAKTFEPVVGRIVDNNFLEALKFVGSLSRSASVNPASAQALTDRLRRVPPSDAEALRVILGQIGQDAAERRAIAAAREKGSPMPPPRTARPGSPGKVER